MISAAHVQKSLWQLHLMDKLYRNRQDSETTAGSVQKRFSCAVIGYECAVVALIQPGTARLIHTKNTLRTVRCLCAGLWWKTSQCIEIQAAGDAVTCCVAANTANAGLKARPQWIVHSCDWLCWLQSPSRVQPHYRSSVLVCPSRVAVAGPSKTSDFSAHVRTSHNEYGPGPSPSPVLACRVVNRCRGQRRRPQPLEVKPTVSNRAS